LVLIHHDEILGVFASRREALRTGYQQLGNVAFLVHEIAAVETPRRIISPAVRG
jgi:hypothetical protein